MYNVMIRADNIKKLKILAAKNILIRIFQNKKILYTFLGICFGFAFPISALIFECIRLKIPLNQSSFHYIHSINPLLLMIHTAPIFLGFFAFFAGSAQDKSNKLLVSDSLTNLNNRYASEQLLNSFDGKMDINSGYLTVVVINMRNIKRINSLMGISFGNEMIIAVANLLNSMCTDGEHLFRTSGTEFMIVKLGNPIKELTTNIAKKLSNPIKVAGLSCLVEINIGVAYCDKEYCNNIIDCAYAAVNRHKFSSNQPYVVFDESMNPDPAHIEMESELFNALKNDEYFLLYQPIIDTKTKAVTGSEALLRWQSPKFGIMSPVIFIPVLERTNTIIDVGFWILETACKQAKLWQDKYNNKDLYMSINVSVSQLFDEDFVEKLSAIVSKVGISKDSIRLEITESVSEDKREFVRNKIFLLGENDFKLSIDDFGTGYSSLAELDSMPLYSLKVDKSFVDRISSYSYGSSVIEMIINMAHKMNLVVVIEGVETKEQYEYLKSIDSDFIQGYYFSKPLSVSDFEKFISMSL